MIRAEGEPEQRDQEFCAPWPVERFNPAHMRSMSGPRPPLQIEASELFDLTGDSEDTEDEQGQADFMQQDVESSQHGSNEEQQPAIPDQSGVVAARGWQAPEQPEGPPPTGNILQLPRGAQRYAREVPPQADPPRDPPVSMRQASAVVGALVEELDAHKRVIFSQQAEMSQVKIEVADELNNHIRALAEHSQALRRIGAYLQQHDAQYQEQTASVATMVAELQDYRRVKEQLQLALQQNATLKQQLDETREGTHLLNERIKKLQDTQNKRQEELSEWAKGVDQFTKDIRAEFQSELQRVQTELAVVRTVTGAVNAEGKIELLADLQRAHHELIALRQEVQHSRQELQSHDYTSAIKARLGQDLEDQVEGWFLDQLLRPR